MNEPTRGFQDFARDLALQLKPYLAIGLSPTSIEYIIVAAMQKEMNNRGK